MHSLSDKQNWALHLAAVATTAAGLYYAYTAGRASARKHKKVFVLAVSLAFKDAADRDRWISTWREMMVDKVRTLEPGTLSYELCISTDDPLKALVYERYTDRAAYEDVHKQSEHMLHFSEATAGIALQVAGQHFEETNLGFM